MNQNLLVTRCSQGEHLRVDKFRKSFYQILLSASESCQHTKKLFKFTLDCWIDKIIKVTLENIKKIHGTYKIYCQNNVILYLWLPLLFVYFKTKKYFLPSLDSLINYSCLFLSINSKSTKLIILQHRKGFRQGVKHCPTASQFVLCTIINGLPKATSIILVGPPYNKTVKLKLLCSVIEILCLLWKELRKN